MVKILMGLKGRESTKINFFADFAIFSKFAVIEAFFGGF